MTRTAIVSEDPTASVATAEPPGNGKHAEPTVDLDDEATADQLEEMRRNLAIYRQHHDDMRAMAEECEEHRERYLDYKQKASAEKKVLDDKYEELRKLALDRPGFGPLFDNKAEDKPGNPPPRKAQPDADAWKATPLDALIPHGVTAKDVEKLAGADVATLGQYQAYVADKTGRGLSQWFKDIKGLGQAGADRIADAFTKWWQEHPQPEAIEDGPAVPETLLEWREGEDVATWTAESTRTGEDSGIRLDFIITVTDDEKYDVSYSDGDLVADPVEPFDTIDAAKAYCDGVERTIRAEAEQAAKADDDSVTDPRDIKLSTIPNVDPEVIRGFVALKGADHEDESAVDAVTVGDWQDHWGDQFEADIVAGLSDHATRKQVKAAINAIRAAAVNG